MQEKEIKYIETEKRIGKSVFQMTWLSKELKLSYISGGNATTLEKSLAISYVVLYKHMYHMTKQSLS